MYIVWKGKKGSGAERKLDVAAAAAAPGTTLYIYHVDESDDSIAAMVCISILHFSYFDPQIFLLAT